MSIEREMADSAGVMDVVARSPRERTLGSWTLAGAISKPCGDISVAGMTELPPGTDTDALVARIMAAVRGRTLLEDVLYR
eukprot:scaffold84832_cov119-Phaeocystis_antarctica.AAC.1